MSKKSMIKLIIGLILIISAYFLNNLTILRQIMIIVGIIFISIVLTATREKKKLFFVIYIFILTSISLMSDYLVCKYFIKQPIFAYNIIKNDKVRVDNAFGYRVWQCLDTGKIIVDPLYKLGYFCNSDDIKEESINNVMSDLDNNYESYFNNFIKVKGRITKKVSATELELNSYTEENDVIKYDGNKVLKVMFNTVNKDIDNYLNNDEIILVGRIDNKYQSNNISYVVMVDSAIILNNYEVFSVNVVKKNNCEADKEYYFGYGDYTFYKSCINSINIIGNESRELNYVMRTGKITLDSLLSKAYEVDSQSIDNSKLYLYNDYRIVVCDNKDVIIGTEKLEINSYCHSYIDNEEKGV